METCDRVRMTQALGEDGVPVRVLKDLAPILAAPLAHLAEQRLSTGKFPAPYKVAYVVPVLKNGKDPSMLSSCRSVALIPAYSKILARLRQLWQRLMALGQGPGPSRA